MKIHAFAFETETEALAFVQGIEFVKDPSLEVESLLVSQSGHGFTVTLVDMAEEGQEKKLCCCE